MALPKKSIFPESRGQVLTLLLAAHRSDLFLSALQHVNRMLCYSIVHFTCVLEIVGEAMTEIYDLITDMFIPHWRKQFPEVKPSAKALSEPDPLNRSSVLVSC